MRGMRKWVLLLLQIACIVAMCFSIRSAHRHLGESRAAVVRAIDENLKLCQQRAAMAESDYWRNYWQGRIAMWKAEGIATRKEYGITESSAEIPASSSPNQPQ